MPIAKPTRTLKATLLSVSVANGQRLVSPNISIDVGVRQVIAEIDGAAWPSGTAIKVELEVSEDGGAIWHPYAVITSDSAHCSGANTKCSVGISLAEANANPAFMVRAAISVTSGPGITLVGSVLVV